MAKKSIERIYFSIAFTIIGLFLCVALITAVLQSSWGKEKLLSYTRSELKKNQIELHFDHLGGILPFQWKLTNMRVETPDLKFEAKEITFRLNLFSLLQKKLTLRKLTADQIHYVSKDSSKAKMEQLPELDFPFPININHFQLSNFHINLGDKPIAINLWGKAKASNQYFLLDTHIERKDCENSTNRIIVREKNRLIQIRVNANETNTKCLEPFYTLPEQILLDGSFFLAASKESLNKWLFHQEITPSIRGKIEGKILSIPSFSSQENKTYFPKPLFFEIPFYSTNNQIRLPEILIEGALFSLVGKASCQENLALDNAMLNFSSGNLRSLLSSFPFETSGSLYTTIHMHKQGSTPYLSFDFLSEHLELGDVVFDDIRGNLNGKLSDQGLIGNVNFSTHAFFVPWTCISDIQVTNIDHWDFRNLVAKSPTVRLNGDLLVDQDRLQGEVFGSFDNLRALELFFDDFHPKAEALVKATFSLDEHNKQNLSLHVDARDFLFQNTHTEHLDFSLEMENLFGNSIFYIDATGYDLYWNRLHLSTYFFQTSNEQENLPFACRAIGYWTFPLEFALSGFFHTADNEISINIQDGSGTLFEHSFVFPKPVNLFISDEKFSLSPLEIDFADSHLFAEALLQKDNSFIRLNAKHFPLEFLSFNPWDLELNGFFSAQMQLEQKKGPATGMLSLSVEDLAFFPGQDVDKTTGQIRAKLEDNSLLVFSDLQIRQNQPLNFKAKIPLNVDLFPFELNTRAHSSFSAELNYAGRLEEILDLVPIGPHLLVGDVNCALSARGSFASPTLSGSCTLKNGIYENYYTGTNLEQIDASFTAKGHNLILDQLFAKGPEQGTLVGTGSFAFLPEKDFPFRASISFQDLLCVEIPLVKASAKGKLSIEGDLHSALAKGRVEIERADFTIPEKIPLQVPHIDVRYVNDHVEQTEEPLSAPPKLYPLHLDLKINAPDQVFAKGKGLNSKWKGNFRILGTIDDLLAKGSLQLVKGDYVFSGHVFDITEGQLTFSGKKHTLPYIAISARANQAGVNVIASLRGPINAPKLNFRSLPPLPLSSILSLLIFGKDISEISGIQAVQLAATVASLAGEGPDILESLGKSLGVDRINLVSYRNMRKETETSDDSEEVTDTEQMGIKVGKYVHKNVLLTFMQGTGADSSNIGVEVDLKHGFLFGAETLRYQDQEGRFFLKWNFHY